MKTKHTKILAISADPDLLGNTASFLRAVGYIVACTRDVAHAELWTAVRQPDICLIDGRSATKLETGKIRELEEAGAANHLKLIFWTDTSSGNDIPRLMSAGATDFVEVNAWGELLSRLRAVQRLQEFEARMTDDCGLDTQSHLMTRDDFQSVAINAWDQGSARAAIQLHLDIGIEPSTARALLASAAANLLQQFTPRPIAMTSSSPGEYQILLGDNAPARQVAEILQKLFADSTVPFMGVQLPLTCSIGIALADHCDSLEGLQHAAKSGAQLASQRGGNTIVDEEQQRGLTEQWRLYSEPDSMYATTTARHLMTPFPWALPGDESPKCAAEAFARGQFASLPVVDDQGRYCGLLRREDIDTDAAAVADLDLSDVPTADVEMPFPEVLSQLHETPVLVVVRDEEPLGIIVAEQLATLDQPYRRTTPVEGEGAERLVVAPV